MLNKQIENFIKTTGEGVVLDYIEGQFVLENKSFTEGKPCSSIGKIQGKGSTLETCIDNFIFCFEKKQYSEKNKAQIEDIESYYWYNSY
jgi:hypothetical protein